MLFLCFEQKINVHNSFGVNYIYKNNPLPGKVGMPFKVWPNREWYRLQTIWPPCWKWREGNTCWESDLNTVQNKRKLKKCRSYQVITFIFNLTKMVLNFILFCFESTQDQTFLDVWSVWITSSRGTFLNRRGDFHMKNHCCSFPAAVSATCWRQTSTTIQPLIFLSANNWGLF